MESEPKTLPPAISVVGYVKYHLNKTGKKLIIGVYNHRYTDLNKHKNETIYKLCVIRAKQNMCPTKLRNVYI